MGMPREGMGLFDPTIAMPVIADKTNDTSTPEGYLGLVDYATFADNTPEMRKHAADNMARLIAKLQGTP